MTCRLVLPKQLFYHFAFAGQIVERVEVTQAFPESQLHLQIALRNDKTCHLGFGKVRQLFKR